MDAETSISLGIDVNMSWNENDLISEDLSEKCDMDAESLFVLIVPDVENNSCEVLLESEKDDSENLTNERKSNFETEHPICKNCNHRHRALIPDNKLPVLSKKVYKCDTCMETFDHQNNWREHLTTHKDQAIWRCEYCFKGFKQKFSLDVHIRHHTGEKPFSCSLCESRFFKKSSLNVHFRRHTGEQIHKCTVCPKSFSNRSDLVKHTRCHTGERPYTCTICKKSFRRNHHLQRHVRNTHKE